MAHPFASVQRAIMNHLVVAPAGPDSGVFDLRAVSRTMQSRHQPAVSRAVHRLVECGVLESMIPTGAAGFRPDDDGWQAQVRFVRRGAGS
jgi:hypothetical protein